MPSSRLIVDVGSGLAKVGYGCTDIPTFLFPSLVGKARKTASPRSALATGDAFVGIDAYKRRGDLSVHRPVQGGIVRGWDDYETLLMAILYQHLRAPETPDIFLAESPTNSSACRERTAEMIFETFDASALTVASQATLSLINSLYGPAALQTSKIPRIVVESGYGVTHVVPYSSNGLPIESAIQSSVDLVGSVLDVQLKLLLAGSNDFSPQQSDGRVFESIKHKHCYVAQDYMLELAKFANNDRSEVERKEIVGEEHIFLNEERFACPEALFRPELLQFAVSQDTLRLSLPALILRAIDAALDDDDTASSDDELSGPTDVWSQSPREQRRAKMLEQVYLSGGNTMFPGLLPRLKSELEMSTQLQADVAGAPDRAYGAWCGASMLLSVEQDYLVPRTVTKENYDEFGSILLHLQLLPG